MSGSTTGWGVLGTVRHRYRAPVPASTFRRHTMIWQTPTAQDFRFGLEITMYIAAR